MSEQEAAEPEQRVTALELFFDLVFVFALTEVTTLLARDLTPVGVARGLAVLAAVWWAWTGWAWLTNSLRVEDDAWGRAGMVAAMAAMLVVSLAVPEAFGDYGVLFGAAYLSVHLVWAALFLYASRDDPGQLGAVVRLAPGILLPSFVILAAGFLEPGPLRASLWAVALAIDFGSPLLAGTGGWRVNAGHFAERHGLIVIIALGESVVTIGVGASAVPLSAGIISAAVLGLLVCAALWWLYFDVVAVFATRRLARAEGLERTAIARDSYSYLHLLLVAGIVLLALGLKKTLAHVDDPLATIPAAALLGGVALYLVAHVLFRLRNTGTVNRARLVVAGVLVLAVPAATRLPALASLAALAALLAGLVAYEALRYRENRAAIRRAATG